MISHALLSLIALSPPSLPIEARPPTSPRSAVAQEGHDGESGKSVQLAISVNAALDEVWDCWTTSRGLVEFLAPAAFTELEIGGPFELYYDLDAEESERGGEGLKILDYTPKERLLVQWCAPPKFENFRGKQTWVEVRLREITPARIQVAITHGGFGEGPEWDKMHHYFSSIWPVMLNNLKNCYITGPFDWSTANLDPVQARGIMEGREAAAAEAAKAAPRHWVIRLEPASDDVVENPTPEQAGAIDAHFVRLQRMLAEGSLILAGPAESKPYHGLVILEATDEATARAMMDGDPAVRAGVMTACLQPFSLALLRGR